MSELIHPTAIVDPGAEIGRNVTIGPYCIVGAGVVLGDDCWLQHHVTVMGPSRIGRGNRFFSYCSIGQQSQDLKYAGEPTHLEMGDGNCFREFCTVNRGTAPGAFTRVGNRGNFLAYAHIAHDCTVGDDVIFSNCGTLGGHVTVEDFAIIGGLTAIHQFCRIGKHAITGGCSKIVQDVPPFMVADGNPAAVRAINQVGLERRGFAAEEIKKIKESFRIIYRSNLNLKQAIERIEEKIEITAEIAHLLQFLRTSERGIVR